MLINENIKNNIYKIITNENSEQDLDQLSKEDLSKIKKIFSYSRIESYLINNKIFKRFDKETAAFLKNIADKRNINSMTIFKDFIDICKDLQEIDIKIIPLKGLHLNLEFYDDISLRPIRDIDLLLCKNEIKRFLKHLEKKGYFLKNDEKKDLQSLLKAKENFLLIINNYPNTDYAIDASFKLDLINDILASKEMYIGRYYFEKKKWISAINRFRTVIDQYNTTIYTEEALHRLVEIHYILGLENEAEKYAQLLGYNFQSSKWYEKTYILFDRNYELNKNKNRKKEKKTNSLIKRIKSLLE